MVGSPKKAVYYHPVAIRQLRSCTGLRNEKVLLKTCLLCVLLVHAELFYLETDRRNSTIHITAYNQIRSIVHNQEQKNLRAI